MSTWTTIVALALTFAELAGAAEDVSADLFAAARKGDVSAVRKQLDSGTDPNLKTEYGATALHFAADRGHLDVVELLLSRKADANAKDTFYSATPLTWAFMRGHAKVVGALIEGGASGGEEMLISAARGGEVELVKVLLEKAKSKPETLAAALRASTKNDVISLLKNAGAKLPEPSKNKDKADDLTTYSGTYKNVDIGELKLTTKDGALVVEADGRRVLTLIRESGEKFKAEGATATATFTKSGGKVTGFDFVAEKQQVRAFTRVDADSATQAKKAPTEVPDPVPDVKKSANWPQFRGIGAAGVADGQFPPTNFDVQKKKNLRWMTPIPGLGHSCPVIWGDRVFLTTAVGNPKATLKPGQYGDVDSVKETESHEWHVLCLDKKTGKVLWDKVACRGVPKVKRHLKGTHANSTPATDGNHLVVSFGAEGLYCFDLDGKQLWKRDIGKLDSGWFYDSDYEWGFGSSPVIWKGRCYIQCDAGKKPFLAAYALANGSEVWNVKREEPPSWGTPTIIEGPERAELVATGTKFARGYDPDTGKELWRVGRLSEISVPTPFLFEGRIVVCSGYRPVQPIFAIKPGAMGDISPKKGETSSDGVQWSTRTGGSYLPTPVGYRGHLYVLSNSGLLACYDIKTGKRLYNERVGGSSFTASPVAADGRIYCVNETEGVRVVRAGPEFELLAVNRVEETCMASPAVADGMLFLRTERHLIALGVTP